MLERNDSSSGHLQARTSGPGARGMVALLVLGAASLLPAAGTMAQSQEEPPEIPRGVPEHYAALRIYAEGEILEVLNGGRALRILAPARGAHLFGDGRSAPRDPLPSIERSVAGLDARDEIIVNLRDAQGWLFIDDPDGGPQERVRMDEGRKIFAPGQTVEIGPAPGLASGATDGTITTQSSWAGQTTSTRVVLSKSVRGWIYIRINRFKEHSR